MTVLGQLGKGPGHCICALLHARGETSESHVELVAVQFARVAQPPRTRCG